MHRVRFVRRQRKHGSVVAIKVDGRPLTRVIAECGEAGCWPLMARIEVSADVVCWADFEQPFRRETWDYGDLRLCFDRGQYETALARLGS